MCAQVCKSISHVPWKLRSVVQKLFSMEPFHTISRVMDLLPSLKHIVLKNEFILKICL